MNSFKRVRAFHIELEFGSVCFEERGKPKYPDKNLSEQWREPTTNSTHVWLRRRVFNPATLVGGECSHHYTNLTPPRGETSCGFAKYRLFSQAF